MRAVIQRVKNASVTVDGSITGEIGYGMLVLVGIHKDDTREDTEYILRKILNIRLWENEDSKMWSKNVKDKGYGILCVSQFTLWGRVKRHNTPDFSRSMGGAMAEPIYQAMLEEFKQLYDPAKVHDGKFGAMMDVCLTNDGPVTIQIDSRDR